MTLSPVARRSKCTFALNPLMRAMALLAITGASCAQDGGGARNFSITPSFSVSEGFTDNLDLRANEKRGDVITQISPALRVSSRAGRVQGTLDYSLTALVYARDTARNDVQNNLTAGFVAEAIENHAFVDVRAAIGQQSISAFGVQSPTVTSVNKNRTETSSLQVSPYLRGRIGSLATLEARLGWGKTSSNSSSASNSSNHTGSLSASGQRGLLGWSADVSQTVSDFDTGRKTKQDRLSLALNYRPDVDWRVHARVGRERNDVRSLQQQSSDSWGAGLDWTPTERTQIGAQYDRRYFGNGHVLTFQHRMAHSVWRYSDSRDVSIDSSGNFGTAIFNTYNLLMLQYAALIPDPVLRDQFVRSQVGSSAGFASNAITVQRRREASVALQGLRSSVSFSAYATESQRADAVSSAVDDLSRAGQVRQHGYGITVSHRLTPGASVNFGYNLTNTADAGPQTGNEQRRFTLSWSGQIAYRTLLSLSVRHVNFDSVTQPYSENGATATLSLQF